MKARAPGGRSRPFPIIPATLLNELDLGETRLSASQRAAFLECLRAIAAKTKADAKRQPTHWTRAPLRKHAATVTRSAESLQSAIEDGDDLAECAVDHLTHMEEINPGCSSKADLARVRKYIEMEAMRLPERGRPGKGWREAFLWHLADCFDRHGMKPTTGGTGSKYTSKFDHTVHWILCLTTKGRHYGEVKELTKPFLKEWRAAQKRRG